MRRAISCVYCAPKSRMRILSVWMSWVIGGPDAKAPARSRRGGSRSAVVRRFLRDLHVVHVRFARAGGGHFHEGRLGAHFLDGGATDVTHRRAQAAGELMHHAAERAAIRHAAFDAFGHEL